MKNVATIKQRAEEAVQNMTHRAAEPVLPIIEAAMRALVADCMAIADQYWSDREIERGCDLCKVAQCIRDEIAAAFTGEPRPEGPCDALRQLIIKGKSG